jgi:3-(3-hydroxy-phenyl)propionate hydroxylase
MKYKPKPRFRAGFQLDTSGPCAAFVGRLIPQPTVTTVEGDQVFCSTTCSETVFSLLVLTEDVGRFATAARAWASLEVKLVVLKREADPIRSDGLTVVVGDASALLGTVAPEVRELVLLVRPDRYVAAAFAVADAAGAARDFEALRAATWGGVRAASTLQSHFHPVTRQVESQSDG